MDPSNLLRLIKLSNIFSGQQQIPIGDPGIGGVDTNISVPMLPPQNEAQQLPYGTADPYQQQPPVDTQPNLYQHQNIDALNRMIANYPVEQPPSKMRRLGAAFVGAGYGPEAADKFLSEPYNKQVVAWKNKVGPVENAATQERIVNQNTRQYQMQQEKQDLANRKLEQDTINKEADRKIRADRAATYDFKAKHPNHVFKENDKGQIIAIDPQSGQTSILADENGEPIKSGILTDVDKANLELEKIAARGEETRKTEAVRETNRQADIKARGTESRATKATPSVSTRTGSVTDKPETPSQTKIRQYLKAREAYNTHPEWQPYIKLGNPGTNDFTVTAPSKGRFFNSGPDDATYKNMTDFISGDSISPVASHNSQEPLGSNKTPPGFPATTVNAPKAPKGWKYVPKQGGGWTAVKDE